jgi:hypothetical protein
MFFKRKIDESVLSVEIVKMGNIYYLYDWENDKSNRNKLVPPTHIKSVTIPMEFFQFESFKKFLEYEFESLFNAKFFVDSKIIYMDAKQNPLLVKNFPLVKLEIPISKLEFFIKQVVDNSFLTQSHGKAIKEWRAIVCDLKFADKNRMNVGVPERGFDWFLILN